MATKITHAKVSTKPEGDDPSQVRTSDWNANHDFTLGDDTSGDVSTAKHGFTPKAPDDVGKFLRGDAAWGVPADLFAFRRVNAGDEAWYTCTTGGVTSAALTANRLYAHPFLVTKSLVADRIGISIQVLAGAGKKCRLGIYNNSNGRPSTLLLDAGEIDANVLNMQAVSIAQSLPPGLYWLAAVSDGTPTVISPYYYYGALPLAQGYELIGGVIVGGYSTGAVYMAHTYGPLPANFSATPTTMRLPLVAVFLRFSA